MKKLWLTAINKKDNKEYKFIGDTFELSVLYYQLNKKDISDYIDIKMSEEMTRWQQRMVAFDVELYDNMMKNAATVADSTDELVLSPT